MKGGDERFFFPLLLPTASLLNVVLISSSSRKRDIAVMTMPLQRVAVLLIVAAGYRRFVTKA